MPTVNLAQFEYPEEASKLPSEFKNFLELGRGTLDVEAYGLKIKLSTIEAWEQREIARRYANLDLFTRQQLSGVDFLTQSIIQISDGKKTFNLTKEEEKVLLRTLLLKMDDKIIRELYDAYLYLERREQENFIKKYGKLREKLAKDFFDLPGLSSEPLASKTQETQSSSPS